jgi:hypothetical protein
MRSGSFAYVDRNMDKGSVPKFLGYTSNWITMQNRGFRKVILLE